jgi:hypothetical protein
MSDWVGIVLGVGLIGFGIVMSNRKVEKNSADRRRAQRLSEGGLPRRRGREWRMK